MSALFEIRALDFVRSGRHALQNVALDLRAGEFIALCGLNGAGKSTLLETMSGLLSHYSGICSFQGKEVKNWPPRLLARQVAFLPQSASAWASFTALEVVRMGRYPFGGGWNETDEDRAKCLESMRLAGCEDLSSRLITELSGGERQRVLFAAALAQEPVVLLLDEPGTFVDLPHQIAMFQTLRQLCNQGRACVAATHDLNLAAAFATRMMLLEDGAIAADAPPAELLFGEAFRRVFGKHVGVDRSMSGTVRVHYDF